MDRKPPRITIEEREMIKALHEQGRSKASIVREVGRSIFIVSKVISGESQTKEHQKNEWRCKDCGVRFKGGYRLYCYSCVRQNQSAKRNKSRAVEVYRRQQIFNAKLEFGRCLFGSDESQSKKGDENSDTTSQG